MPISNIPCEIKDGVEYYFGVPKIEYAEQRRLLIDASEKFHTSTEDNSSQTQNKCIQCKNAKVTAPLRSYCIECAADKLDRLRRTSKGSDIRIDFQPSEHHLPTSFTSRSGRSEEQPAITLPHRYENFIVHLGADNHFTIDGAPNFPIPYECKWMPRFVMVVTHPVYMDGELLTGIKTAKLIRRYVCRNILDGQRCMSLDPNYIPDNFFDFASPKGLPGWSDGGSTQMTKSDIILHECCHACVLAKTPKKYVTPALRRGIPPQTPNAPAPNAPSEAHPRAPAFGDQDLREAQYWKNLYNVEKKQREELAKENATLRQFIANIMAPGRSRV